METRGRLIDSYSHLGGATPLSGETIDRRFRRIVARHPQHEALVSLPQHGRRFTYDQLDAGIQRVARGLVGMGVSRGDRVGIWSTDNAEWVLVQMATARIGAVLVNINPAYRVEELRHALTLAEVQTLVMIPSFRSSDYVGMIRELLGDELRSGSLRSSSHVLPSLERLILYEPDDPGRTLSPEPAIRTWNEMLDAGSDVTNLDIRRLGARLDPDDPINIQFTSGTTGAPKAVVLTHHNLVNNAFFQGEVMQFTANDRLCVPVPFYHCFGMVVSMLLCLMRGAGLVVPAPHFEAGATLRAIAAERCTAVHGVPTMFIEELESPDFREHDLSSLRTGVMAGAPCPPELVRRVIEDMGCREILIGYGQTEASPITHSTRPDDSFERRVDTVGTNLPHQEVKVVDTETGEIVPIGVQGEVCFRGYHVMRGYYRNPDATARAIDPAGWLHSGDLGVMDVDGYLRITERLKDMIIRGGENIYPAEIEAFYFQHPDVAEIAVFGVPDERMGEEVGAWVKPRGGAHLAPEQLRDWARGHIAHYKIPKHFWVVDEFPMTVTGKIQKFRIREIVAEQMQASS